MRRLYIMVVLVMFFAGYALAARHMETVLAEGKTVLLALAPVDPRAPLMGDYMALRYVVNDDIRKALQAQKASASGADVGGAEASATTDTPRVKRLNDLEESCNGEGFAVLRITNDPVPQAAAFVRLHDGSPLQADEFLLAYRLRGYQVTSAAPAFYFQEGTAQQYAGAKFGVFKLAADGKTLLVTLCNQQGERLPLVAVPLVKSRI